ncbi:MAG TPA: OmpH family outer membrane protein [Bryobacteraceae bacterium]|nr:OmpH family outer membrane protein [Bryobacteraceae bacterium]
MLKKNLLTHGSLGARLMIGSALVLGAAVMAQAQSATPTKIGIIHVQAAILGTKEGKKAGEELNAKFGQKKAELEKKQANIDQLKDQLQKGSATMSDEAKEKLMRQIDSETTALKRATEDAQADVEQEESKIINELGAKLYTVVVKYAKDNGYTMIIDVSQQNQPVWWAADSINITNEVIGLYDKAYPGAGAAATDPKPAAPTGSAPAPSARPATTPTSGPAAPPSPARKQ